MLDFAGVWGQALLSSAVSLLLGAAVSLTYAYKNSYHRDFVITLVLLPIMVQAIISIVNGNLGSGVAVIGAFGLIRFRSVAGGAREMGAIFFAMACGLATGSGHIGFAIAFCATVAIVSVILINSNFGKGSRFEKELKITIPENLEYNGVFDDIFADYTVKWELISVKTTDMGSLFELKYKILLKDISLEKEFLDKLRCRNGNLSIVCQRAAVGEGL